MSQFRLDDGFVSKYVGKQPQWGPLGYVTYKRTYARSVEVDADGRGTIAKRHLDLAREAGLKKTEEFWLTLTRVVEGTFEIQRKHCESLRLPWDEAKAQKSAQEMFKLMWAFKFLPPGRGLWMMGTPIIDKIGAAALNNPLEEDTRILTEEHGWVKLKEVEGKEITVLTSTKLYGRDNSSASSPKWVKASVSHAEVHPCVEIEFLDDFKQTTKIVASLNHRWFKKENKKGAQWERVTSEDLREGDIVPIVRPRLNFDPSRFGMQHGLFFGDGTRSNGLLNQFSDSMHLLDDLFDSRDIVTESDERKYVANCPLSWGELPTQSQISDKRYLMSFLMGYFAADGTVTEEHCAPLISSARLDELTAVKSYFELLGIRTTKIVGGSRETNFGESEIYSFKINKHDLWPEFFLKRSHREKYERHMNSITVKQEKCRAMVKSVRPVGEHRVLCATVPFYEQFVTEGFILTSNCAFVSTAEIATSFSAPFCFLMDMSMLGVGVGGDTRGAGKVSIVEPEQSDNQYTIPDSREGWVEALRIVLDSFVGKSALPRLWDASEVRPKGSPIKGFGGTASGPEPLLEMLAAVEKLLRARVGKKIRSSDIVDIFNLVGRCVVAGNVRRSAEIMFGDAQDPAFLELKDPEKNLAELQSHRWASNNSIFASVGQDYSKVAALTAKNGEPGYMWLENARAFSRMGREADWRDAMAAGGNPCLEQTLESFELCCLVETFVSRHKNYDDYENTLKYAYMYAKTVTLVPTHDPRTNAVLLRNRRIGTSQSGIASAVKKFGRRRYFEMCDTGYEYLRSLDREYSRWLCVPESNKITSVKPSGTISLLPGVPPGIHFPHSEYYFRVIRFDSDSSIVTKHRAANYLCVDIDPAKEPNTTAIYFAVHEEDFDRGEADVSMWEQLENAAQVQQHWADNQVSVTVKFDKQAEGPQIKYALELYETRLKGVSFLPHDDHGYEHAPYQKITKEQYDEYVAKLLPVVLDDSENEEVEKFCDGDACKLPMKAVV